MSVTLGPTASGAELADLVGALLAAIAVTERPALEDGLHEARQSWRSMVCTGCWSSLTPRRTTWRRVLSTSTRPPKRRHYETQDAE